VRSAALGCVAAAWAVVVAAEIVAATVAAVTAAAAAAAAKGQDCQPQLALGPATDCLPLVHPQLPRSVLELVQMEQQTGLAARGQQKQQQQVAQALCWAGCEVLLRQRLGQTCVPLGKAG